MDIKNSMRFKKLVIKEIVEEVPGTKSFVLADSGDPANQLVYKAGQFLTFAHLKPNGEITRKNYSLSSAPVLNEPLTITVKRIPNGEFSRKLIDDAHVGDELLCLGASGFFTLPKNIEAYKQIVFMAAGSGIAPIYSLIKTVLNCYPLIKVVLIYSNSSLPVTIFYEKLQALHESFLERFKIEFLFSNAPNLLRARLNVSLLEEILAEHTGKIALKDILFYTCGPFDYMRMVSIYLSSRKIADGQLKKELFTIEKLVKKPQPPDKDAHTVILQEGGKIHHLEVRFPETILQAAKKKDIDLPYSCESGQCGTCAVWCIKGKVWMYRNDVLLDQELEQGRVLTCTGYPIEGDVILKIN